MDLEFRFKPRTPAGLMALASATALYELCRRIRGCELNCPCRTCAQALLYAHRLAATSEEQ